LKIQIRRISAIFAPDKAETRPGRLATYTHPRYTFGMHVHAAPSSPGAHRTKSVLRFSLVATLIYVAVTFVAGLRAHSLALLSEAGHNASDFLALLLSFAAVYFQTRPASDSKTFGYQRAGVLAAFINAATLIIISLWIGVEAVHRLSAPVAVQPRLMMIVAAAGVVMNGVIAALLWSVARDVNMRSAFIHMAGDTLSTAAVIAGGAGILFTGQNWIDPVLSLLIAALILWSSFGIVRETLNILLEGTPRGVSLPAIRSNMAAVDGVINVHDLHVWCLGSQSRALACHVTIADIPPSESACILLNLNRVLKEHFHISHTTIQFEHTGCEELQGCVVPIEEMASSAASEHHGHHHGHAH
jgi:cobalt-zinc-cadmium efflux system protein